MPIQYQIFDDFYRLMYVAHKALAISTWEKPQFTTSSPYFTLLDNNKIRLPHIDGSAYPSSFHNFRLIFTARKPSKEQLTVTVSQIAGSTVASYRQTAKQLCDFVDKTGA